MFNSLENKDNNYKDNNNKDDNKDNIKDDKDNNNKDDNNVLKIDKFCELSLKYFSIELIYC